MFLACFYWRFMRAGISITNRLPSIDKRYNEPLAAFDFGIALDFGCTEKKGQGEQ